MSTRKPPQPKEIGGPFKALRVAVYFRHTGDHYAVALAAYNANRPISNWILDKILPIAEAENIETAKKKRAIKSQLADLPKKRRRG